MESLSCGFFSILVTFLPSVVHFKFGLAERQMNYKRQVQIFHEVFYLMVINCIDINYKRVSKMLNKMILDG